MVESHHQLFCVCPESAASKTSPEKVPIPALRRGQLAIRVQSKKLGGRGPVPHSGSHTPRAYRGRGTRAEGALWPAHDPRRHGDQEKLYEAREQAAPERRSPGRSASPCLPRAPASRIRRRRHRMFFRSGPPRPRSHFLPCSPPPRAPRPAPAPCLTPSRPRPGSAANLECPGRRRTAPTRTASRVEGIVVFRGPKLAISRTP